MRLAVSFLLLSCFGCDESPNRQEFTNLSVSVLNDHDRITELATGAKPGMGTLAADVAGLRDQVATQATTITKLQADLAAAQQRLAAGGILHRIGPDREDLGIGAPGSSWVWVPDVGGEVNLESRSTVYYKAADCKGDGFVEVGLARGDLTIIPGGDLLNVDTTSLVKGGEWVSQRDKSTAACIAADAPQAQSGGYSKWTFVRHFPDVHRIDTHLELR